MRCLICRKILTDQQHGVESHLRTHKLEKAERDRVLDEMMGGAISKRIKYRKIKAKINAGERVPREDFLIVKGIDQRTNLLPEYTRDRPEFKDNVKKGYLSKV